MSLKNNDRFAELDALRGVAAIAVLIHHFLYVYSNRFGYESFSFQDVDISNSLGRYGVELFFMVSGFVISMSLENKKGIRYFFISRFSRLFPTFWFCLFVTLVFKVTFASFSDFSFSNIAANITMIPLMFWEKPIDGSYWTLMYELFFYSLIAMTYKLMSKHYIVLFAVFVLIGVLLLSFGITQKETRAAYFLLIPHGQLFLAGVVFYRLWLTKSIGGNEYLLKLFLVSLLLIQLGLSFIETDRLNLVSFSMIALFFFTFLLMIQGKLRFIASRPLCWAGTISYSLYLIHQEIGYILINRLVYQSFNEIIAIIFSMVVVFLLSFLINKKVEKPSDRWFRRRLTHLLN